MAKQLRPASSFSAFAQEAARAACVEFAIFAPVIKRRLALTQPLRIEEEPDYTPDDEPMPARAPRAMLSPTRSQVENGFITAQSTAKRTTKPGSKADPRATRRSTKGPRR